MSIESQKKSKVTMIKIDEKNSAFLKRKNNFNHRWNITNIKTDKNDFKNRCLNIINSIFDNIYEYNPRNYEIEKLCEEIRLQLGIEIGIGSDNHFCDTDVCKKLKKLDLNEEEDFLKFLYAMETICNYEPLELDKSYKKDMIKKIAEALKMSNINAVIYKFGNEYQICPVDVEFLNEKLVVDILSWLNDYPETKKHFQNAIKEKRTEEKYRTIVDELRLSLELFFKKLFSNEKSLENQLSNIGDYLKQNNIAPEINNMYVKLIDYYCKYNNNTAKHNDNVAELEIDYIIYTTGSFIRLMLQIDKNSNKI